MAEGVLPRVDADEDYRGAPGADDEGIGQVGRKGGLYYFHAAAQDDPNNDEDQREDQQAPVESDECSCGMSAMLCRTRDGTSVLETRKLEGATIPALGRMRQSG